MITGSGAAGARSGRAAETRVARPLTVALARNLRSLTFTPSRCSTLAISRTAPRESIPLANRSSSAPTSSEPIPSSPAIRSAICPSTAVRARRGAGSFSVSHAAFTSASADRSTLPLRLSGIAGSGTKTEGTMYSGRLLARPARISAAVAVPTT